MKLFRYLRAEFGRWSMRENCHRPGGRVPPVRRACRTSVGMSWQEGADRRSMGESPGGLGGRGKPDLGNSE